MIIMQALSITVISMKISLPLIFLFRAIVSHLHSGPKLKFDIARILRMCSGSGKADYRQQVWPLERPSKSDRFHQSVLLRLSCRSHTHHTDNSLNRCRSPKHHPWSRIRQWLDSVSTIPNFSNLYSVSLSLSLSSQLTALPHFSSTHLCVPSQMAREKAPVLEDAKHYVLSVSSIPVSEWLHKVDNQTLAD